MPGAGFRATILVSVVGVYREHYQGVFRFFRTLFLYGAHERALQHAISYLLSLDFWEGRSYVTHKFKWLQRESAHAGGTIRKPSTRSTR